MHKFEISEYLKKYYIEINYILNYIKLYIRNSNHISQYYCFFLYFDQIDTALVSIRDFWMAVYV